MSLCLWLSRSVLNKCLTFQSTQDGHKVRHINTTLGTWPHHHITYTANVISMQKRNTGLQSRRNLWQQRSTSTVALREALSIFGFVVPSSRPPRRGRNTGDAIQSGSCGWLIFSLKQEPKSWCGKKWWCKSHMELISNCGVLSHLEHIWLDGYCGSEIAYHISNNYNFKDDLQ